MRREGRMASAGIRLNLYLPARMARGWDGSPGNRSARGVQLLDRMAEALRRSSIIDRFTEAELAVMRQACRGWVAEPATAVFGGVALELKGRALSTPPLLEKLAALSPFDEIALVEWIERQDREDSRREGTLTTMDTRV